MSAKEVMIIGLPESHMRSIERLDHLAIALHGIECIAVVEKEKPMVFEIKAMDFDRSLLNLTQDDLKVHEPFWKSLPKYRKERSK